MGIREELRGHRERADAALAKGAAEAVAELERAVLLDPRGLATRQRLAALLALAGQPRAAVHQLQQVAGRYALEGLVFKAIAVCRVILALEPGHVETQEALADLFALRPDDPESPPALPPGLAGALGPGIDPDLPGDESSAPLDLTLGALCLWPPAAAPEPPLPAPAAGEPVPLDPAGLGRAPLFSHLERDAFLALLRRLALRWTRAGEVILAQGQAGDAMFIVVQGKVRVFAGEERAPDRALAVLGEGSCFGEKALLGDAPRATSVVAAEDGLLFALDRATVTELEARYPAVRPAVEEFLRERLLANLLEVSPLFHAFAPAQKQALARRFWVRDLESGTSILEQGHPGAGFFVLLRGACEVFHTAADGGRHHYPALGEGDVFGEISLLFDSPCTASVRTTTPCVVLELPKPDFAELVLPNPTVKERVAALAQERLDRTAGLVAAEERARGSWLV